MFHRTHIILLVIVFAIIVGIQGCGSSGGNSSGSSNVTIYGAGN